MAATVKVYCKKCGKEFQAREADRRRGWGVFCSKSCKAAVQEQRTGQYRAFKARSQYTISVEVQHWDWSGPIDGQW